MSWLGAPVLPVLGVSLLLVTATRASLADEPLTARLQIAGGAFSPKELRLPAGVQVKLLIRNDDALPAEFESTDLSREVVVPGHTQVTTYVGPLKPGRYRFFNDFDQAMQGEVVAEDRSR
jgi:plastocyanin